ncbi:MAG: UvrD-helicase domain-containing protein [Erysipelotrichaceae bacterium]|nr:UvrD-helicase domain-containing protein [Erysipelotrichaceae bacterium]
MSQDWTPEQIRAIEESGKNILVSAGAGSGKTTVLTERVLQHLLNGMNIDRMLILTFTNAAAAQMKDKIRDKLKKRLAAGEDRDVMTAQLQKIDSSYIMTFDAYAQSLVRKYNYLLNVSKEISIIDENIISLKTEQFLEEIMTEKYREASVGFESLVGDFCSRDDDKIRKWVIFLNKRLSLRRDREEYLDQLLDPAESESRKARLFEEYVALIRRKQGEVDEMFNEFSTMDVSNYAEIYDSAKDLLTSETYADMHDNMDYKLPAIANGSSEEAKRLKKEIKEKMDDIREMVHHEKEELLKQYDHSQGYLRELVDLVRKLKARLDEYKQASDLYEYSDIFAMAIRIVDEHEDIRREISEHFQEIMIDEYQDTSDLQEYFISRIAHDNVYMVGDIKQSIYRFRNANPDIFQHKYEDFRDGSQPGEVIDLLSNFRSRHSVVEDINTTFGRLMDRRIGGADYLKEHQMIAGQKNYPADGDDYHMELLSYVYKADKQIQKPFAAPDNYGRPEAEAFIIASDIKRRISEGFKVFDLNDRKERPATYGDFCILIDRSKHFDLFKKILTFLEIPARIEQDEELQESDLLTVIKNILRLVHARRLFLAAEDDETRGKVTEDVRYNFVSLARSFLCRMEDSVIYELIKKEDFLNTPLMEKIERIGRNIKVKSISDLLDEIVEEFDIYGSLNRIGQLNDNQVRLEYLYDLAHRLNKLDYDYVSFIEHLDHIFDNDRSISFSMNKPDIDAVRIQTIHKSKGLEYHICYFPLLYTGFNTKDRNEAVVVDRDCGIIVQDYVDGRGKKDTFVKELYKESYDRENISERIRLLYVAMTRTQEKIILVGPFEDGSDSGNGIIPDYRRMKINSMIDMINCQYDQFRTHITDVVFGENGVRISRDYNRKKADGLKALKKNTTLLTIKSHPTCQPETITSSRYSKHGGQLITKEQKNSMEFGTKMHYYLEILDLAHPDYSLIDAGCRYKIRKFLESDLMKDVASGRAYKEYEFVYEEEGLMRHGFIDLLMEYDDHFDIIDYKLKNIDDENYDMQLTGYRQYLQSISNKPVNCYLYSLTEERFREVD